MSLILGCKNHKIEIKTNLLKIEVSNPLLYKFNNLSQKIKMTRVSDKKNGNGGDRSSKAQNNKKQKKESRKKLYVDSSSDEEEDDSEYLPSNEEETTVYETADEDSEEEEESEDTEVLVEKFINGKKKHESFAAKSDKKSSSKKRDKKTEKSEKNEKSKKNVSKKPEKTDKKNVKDKKFEKKSTKHSKKYEESEEESEEEDSEEEDEDSDEEEDEDSDEEEDEDSDEEEIVISKSSKKGGDKKGGGILVMNIMDMLESAMGEDEDDYIEDEFAEEYETDEDDEVNTDDEKMFMKETYVDPPAIVLKDDKKKRGGGEARNLIDSTSEEEENRIRAEEEELAKKLTKCLPASQLKNSNTKPLSKKEEERLRKEKSKKDKSENSEDKSKEEKDKVLKKYQTLDDMRKFMTERLAKDPDNKILKNALQDIKENIHKLVKKARSENARKFHEMVSEKVYSTGKINDLDYFKKKLSNKEQLRAMADLKEINEHIYSDKPFRMAILEMDISYKHKAIALSRLDTMKQMEMSSESGGFTKMKEWLETFMRIPFGRYRDLPVKISDGHDKCYDFMSRAKQTLDECTYGLNDAKMQIMQVLGNWISNPNSMGTAIAIRGPPGSGKCLVKDTPVLMYDGSVKMVQDIQVGELLMGDDSTPRTVLALGSGKDDLYDIVPKKGETYGVNSEHILCLKPSGLHRIVKEDSTANSATKYKVEYFDKTTFTLESKSFEKRKLAAAFLAEKVVENGVVDIPVKTLLGLSEYIQSRLKGYSAGAKFPSKKVPFEPYNFGVWLGGGKTTQSKTFDKFLKQYGLTENHKYIPDVFKINDRKVQLEILAGLVDAFGEYSITKRGYEITQNHKRLSDDILFVARSLGFTAYEKTAKKVKEEEGHPVYSIHISGYGLHEVPVKISGKKAVEQKKPTRASVTGIKIVAKGHGDYYGFELDGNHRYLLGSFTVTHNTTLVRDGISKILGREFAFITLGGATDSAFLDGFSYTYEGAKWGKIVQILLDSKSMNPVIYFDELDKISTTERGQEISGILTHLTDTSQNNQFHDKYFSEIDFDLSRCLFIFSYNDEALVNPILKDRMYVVETKGYSNKEKVIIAQKYLLPKILEQVFFRPDEVMIPDETIQYMLEKPEMITKEEGVRNLKRALEIIVKKLNLLRLMTITPPVVAEGQPPVKKAGIQLFGEEFNFEVKFPMNVTKEHVDSLIKTAHNARPKAWDSMYV